MSWPPSSSLPPSSCCCSAASPSSGPSTTPWRSRWVTRTSCACRGGGNTRQPEEAPRERCRGGAGGGRGQNRGLKNQDSEGGTTDGAGLWIQSAPRHWGVVSKMTQITGQNLSHGTSQAFSLPSTLLCCLPSQTTSRSIQQCPSYTFCPLFFCSFYKPVAFNVFGLGLCGFYLHLAFNEAPHRNKNVRVFCLTWL